MVLLRKNGAPVPFRAVTAEVTVIVDLEDVAEGSETPKHEQAEE